MNITTGKLTRADFESRFLHDDHGCADDPGLTLAVHRHEGLDVEPMTAADVWHCPPSQTPPEWFGRPGRGATEDVQPEERDQSMLQMVVLFYAFALALAVGAAIFQAVSS